MPRVAGALAALAAALLLAGCGAPDELPREDAERMRAAAEGLEDAIDARETLRTSRAEARRLRSKVRAIVSRGAFEIDPLDEFGLAALGDLQLVVPSLVVTDEDGTPQRLDRAATRAFLEHAESDPDRALRGPARRHVEAIERVLSDSGADAGTRVPREGRVASGDGTVGEMLARLERDLRPAFPPLALRLKRAREEL